ncbi:MAG: hypothetical protein ACK5SQ_14785 [Chitinophagales bacterium]
MARSSITTQFGSVAALIAVLTINFLSVSLPLNGNTPGALSDLYPNLFTPAGSTFSIWGIIYTLLIIWVLAPFWGQESAKRGAANIGNLFLYTCILNGAWLFAWHWQLTALSVAIMVALLLVLIRINVLLRDPAIQPFWALPFGVYQGWISVALIANVTAWLVGSGWNGGAFEAEITVGMVGIGALIAAWMLFQQRNYGHALAVTWALYGIFLKREGIPGADSELVGWAAKAAALGLGMLIVYSWVKKWSDQLPSRAEVP